MTTTKVIGIIITNSGMSRKLSDTNQVGRVSSFEELINKSFKGEMNAICWQRDLPGNFNELVAQLQLKDYVTEVSRNDLLSLTLSASANLAREIILNDLSSLTEAGAQPSLNLIKCYERDQEFDFISTDVYSYHVDRSPVASDTFLCTYHGTASEILPNNEVQQKILIPEIRRKLEDLYDGPAARFEAFLQEHFFDLHYQAMPEAKSINLGIGNLCKLAVDYPEQQVLPCVHRAPIENEGEYRLLLIC